MANIIGDIAGNFNTLMALLDKMPDEEVISIGDMVDRGPRSKEVIEWFMKNGKAIFGNHEHLMLDHYDEEFDFYQHGTWVWNGGGMTIQSFGGTVPDNVLTWVRGLPKYMEIDGTLISHAFVHPYLSVEEACNVGNSARDLECDRSLIWTRVEPAPREEYDMQIAGHNSQFGHRNFSDNDNVHFATCIDSSAQKVLTGINIPTMRIYQQEYID